MREAGDIALGYFRDGARNWTKADDSPVTEADIAVDRFLAERLPPLVEGSAWLSEETADDGDRISRRHVWIVDPIDGTRAFVERKPEWVVSVALVEDGAPVAGVVRNACSDVTHAATRGGGAWRNGVRMTAEDSEGLEGLTVGGAKSMLGKLKPHGAAEGPWHYALANRLVQVVGGDLDAAVARPNAHDWDIAAAHVILEEAGARLIGLDGAVPSYNRASTRHGGLIAAGPRRALAIAAALSDADLPERT
ncbi:MAG: 3'(2'),5'-bisphosphate nucleotidase CysQ [Ancylobacter novellus]|uniref:3'(2'),5'-bisphosphate nucleotidase CysQ n=1 Tax=Ancylobacter novellus TaxID=921 RepID=A0A2W5KKB7_ANCNO|nr:MAG: 3'(2'),5'-bisphosphate nucleotidase CysQ [Ancylobacter novellus]